VVDAVEGSGAALGTGNREPDLTPTVGISWEWNPKNIEEDINSHEMLRNTEIGGSKLIKLTTQVERAASALFS
jgi:hypothetical protein